MALVIWAFKTRFRSSSCNTKPSFTLVWDSFVDDLKMSMMCPPMSSSPISELEKTIMMMTNTTHHMYTHICSPHPSPNIFDVFSTTINSYYSVLISSCNILSRSLVARCSPLRRDIIRESSYGLLCYSNNNEIPNATIYPKKWHPTKQLVCTKKNKVSCESSTS